MPFWIASAPEVFQNVMFHLFRDIEGVEVIVDDLVVWGEDVEQHHVRLRQALDFFVSATLSLTGRNAIFEHLKFIVWATC